MTGAAEHGGCVLLLMLFVFTLISGVNASSKSASFAEGVCPERDLLSCIVPHHQMVCPVVDVSSAAHWRHAKRTAVWASAPTLPQPMYVISYYMAACIEDMCC